MSQNIEQIYVTNPITTNASTDLMYFGQSPYGSGDDAAMTFANFRIQTVANGTANQLAVYASTGGTVSGLTVGDNGVLITSNAGAPSWLANGTVGQVLTANTGAPPSWQNAGYLTGAVLLAPASLQTITNYDLVINGVRAGQGVGSSATNTVFGATALAGTNTNTDVTAIGASALNASTGSAADITAIGYNALLLATAPGANNTVIGSKAMSGSASQTGADNTAIGFSAFKACTTSSQSVAIGSSAMSSVTTGGTNTAIGYQALKGVTTGTGNVAIGANVLSAAVNSITEDTVAIGFDAMSTNSAAAAGSFCVAIGVSALSFATGQTNTAVGAESGISVSSGSFNTMYGYYSGAYTTSGGIALTTGTYNTLIGTETSTSSASTTGSIALGAQAIAVASTGSTSMTLSSGISFGSAAYPVGVAGDGSLFTGGTTAGYWSPSINGANYYIPLLATTVVDNGAFITGTTGTPSIAALTDGQVIIGSSAGAPLAATLSAGSGISIANGHNTITISSSGGGIGWSSAASTPITAAVNTGYVITDASQVTITLPAVAALGSVVRISGNGAGGWILAPGAGQTINVNGAVASTSITSGEATDSIEVVCVVASTTWNTISYVTLAGFTVS